jgi:DNA-directed RNA polymerases I and III subunit RPAC2
MAMLEPSVENGTKGYPSSLGPKLSLLASPSPNAHTFQVRDEDHTLANPLRYILLTNPAVVFCGYAIAHPSDPFFSLRVQTDGSVGANECLDKALNDLMDVCGVIRTKFEEAM